MTIRVHSEIAPLRRVLIHRPGAEIDRMVPAMMEQLLFDDLLDGEKARQEHRTFVSLLEHFGVEVLEAERLLAEVLEVPQCREEVLEQMGRRHRLVPPLVERLGELEAAELAAALIGGLRRREEAPHREGAVFDLLPVPNYFFQRDPQMVLGDQVVLGSMATEARDREPVLARALFRHHPALAGSGEPVEVHHPPHAAPDFGPAFPFATLEGGDVLVASREVLLVGVSERTNRRGAEALAFHLRALDTPFRYLLLVELPPRRAFMHLDTVFTFIDRGLCLAYEPVVRAGTPESAHVYRADLRARELSFTVEGSLLTALDRLGVEVEVVPCGGGGDYLEQQREQWTDGANAFAVAPGLILLYRRNRRTVEQLASRGWRVLTEGEASRASFRPASDLPTVVVFEGYELSRARGGPRCMTMPLEREEEA